MKTAFLFNSYYAYMWLIRIVVSDTLQYDLADNQCYHYDRLIRINVWISSKQKAFWSET